MQTVASLAKRLDMTAEEALEKLRFMMMEVESVDSELTDDQCDLLIDVDDDPAVAERVRQKKLDDEEKARKRTERLKAAAQKAAAKRKQAAKKKPAAKKTAAKAKAAAKKTAARKAPNGHGEWATNRPSAASRSTTPSPTACRSGSSVPGAASCWCLDSARWGRPRSPSPASSGSAPVEGPLVPSHQAWGWRSRQNRPVAPAGASSATGCH